jgi:hypothetical protein
MAPSRIQSRRRSTWVAVPVLIAAASIPAAVRADMELTLERVGHWGGCSTDVQIVGDRAYLAIGPRVVVLDVSSPDEPTFLGHSEPLPNVIMAIDTDGELAYAVVYKNGLHILDVSNPSSITHLGSDTPGINCWGIVARDGYAYAGDRQRVLHTYDVHDPTHPTLVDSTPTSDLVNGVHFFGGYLYVPTWAAIDVFDISVPEHPTLVYGIPEPGGFFDLAFEGDLLYGVNPAVFGIWDISDPQQPTALGHYFHSQWGTADGIAVSAGFAYAANYDRIYVVDVRDPNNPAEMWWVDVDPWVHAMTTSDGTLFVANWFYGLATFDISVPEIPIEIGHYDNTAHAAAIGIHNGYAYLTGYRDEVQIIDISSPENPTRHAQQALGLSRMHIVDDIAYIATWRPFDVQALDIARFNEENGLDFISHTPLPDGPHDVIVDGNFAYVGVSDSGLWVIDVSDLEAPVVRGTCPLYEPTGQRIAVRFPYAYVATGASEEWNVVDVSDPDNPFLVRTLDSGGPAESILVEDDRLYLGRGSGFNIYSLTQPDDPALLGQFSQAGVSYLTCMIYRDNRLYTSPGLSVVDVSDPASPRLLGNNIYGSRLAEDIELQGRYVYAAHNSSGLSVFKICLIADFDDDGDVDESDLLNFLGRYGTCVGDADYSEAADFDDDGCINLSDLAELLSHFGNQL